MDILKIIENLKKSKIPTEREVRLICKKVKEILFEENNIQPVRTPVSICGDIHGHYYDLLKIFTLKEFPPFTNFIFIGDFVDRG